MDGTATWVALYRVRPGRSDELARWWSEVAGPAARRYDTPPGGWQVLRSTGEEDVFVLLFSGGEAEDWELEPVLLAAYGAERAAQELETLLSLVEGEPEFWPVAPVAF